MNNYSGFIDNQISQLRKDKASIDKELEDSKNAFADAIKKSFKADDLFSELPPETDKEVIYEPKKETFFEKLNRKLKK